MAAWGWRGAATLGLWQEEANRVDLVMTGWDVEGTEEREDLLS